MTSEKLPISEVWYSFYGNLPPYFDELFLDLSLHPHGILLPFALFACIVGPVLFETNLFLYYFSCGILFQLFLDASIREVPVLHDRWNSTLYILRLLLPVQNGDLD